jgi:hypothetical protein
VDRVDNRLAAFDDILDIIIEVDNPSNACWALERCVRPYDAAQADADCTLGPWQRITQPKPPASPSSSFEASQSDFRKLLLIRKLS